MKNLLINGKLGFKKYYINNNELIYTYYFLCTSIMNTFLILFFSLMKNYTARPNYNQLLELKFITQHAKKETNVAAFVEEILNLPDAEKSA